MTKINQAEYDKAFPPVINATLNMQEVTMIQAGLDKLIEEAKAKLAIDYQLLNSAKNGFSKFDDEQCSELSKSIKMISDNITIYQHISNKLNKK
ncbi:hypothetical protein [Mariprofundus ferrooxydans]|uniref:hypothetical protein n=1 Tax=Mariprofundus ferrooxydans TaxID=314344 RepID=UPI0003649FEC|nr:hypothetical protein [Mariprofundus ferrooxydans]